MAVALGILEVEPPTVPPARDGELGTKTRCFESTEELTNSTDEEEKERQWLGKHVKYQFSGQSRIACVIRGRLGNGQVLLTCSY